MTAEPRAHAIAAGVRDAFDRFQEDFVEVTRRARRRFEQREWRSIRDDAVQRLDLYANAVTALVQSLRAQGQSPPVRADWHEAKGAYTGLVDGRLDRELAETFFNSVVRRIFGVVGQDAELEFTSPREVEEAPEPPGNVCRVFEARQGTQALVREIVLSHGLAAPFHSLDDDCRLAAERIEAALAQAELGPLDHVETLAPLFFRNKGAYVIGRVRAAGGDLPLALSLMHPKEGVCVDAVLLGEDELSILFSYAYSYFHAPIVDFSGTIRYLRGLMPRKRVGELYNALGHHKHGKTEIYRELRSYLASTPERFEFAPGRRGMVMVVFTLPSYDLVFKVIKDRFDPPKRGTRAQVKANYQLVTHHDRVGRLVDAQEYEHLEFHRGRFADDLLAALVEQAGEVVSVDGDRVVLKHLYIERRVVPLNVHVEEAPPATALDSLLDYGTAIKDLAAANVFPGDLFLKNFGVTRHGRVVFYDYDEISLVTDLRFRRMPEAITPEDELAAEPWFHVDESDIFPEEIINFLGIRDELRAPFLEAHGDLFEPGFWDRVQALHRRGAVLDVYPYKESARLRPGAARSGLAA